MLSLGEDN